jgi:hypothetical protein
MSFVLFDAPDLHVFRDMYDDLIHFETNDEQIHDYRGIGITIEQMDELVKEYREERDLMLRRRG